jgi:hypothetical protein
MTPSPYQTALAVGNNIAAGVRNYQDRTAIDEILEKASSTGNPEDVDYAMTQILSRVSPEKQQMALAILQKKKSEVEAKNEKQRIKSAYELRGIPAEVADLPPEAQKDYFKQRAEKEKRLGKEKSYEEAGLPKSWSGLDAQAQSSLIRNKSDEDLFNRFLPSQNSYAGQQSPIVDENIDIKELNQPDSTAGPLNMGQTLNQFSPESQMQPQSQPRGIQDLTDEQLVLMSGMRGPGGQIAKAEQQRRQENRKLEQKDLSEKKQDIREAKKETLPLRQEILKKANSARKSITNKNELLRIINTGNINDPTFSVLAEALPFNLGKRLLSNETVEYKAGLVDEFGDLRNVFEGQTRVKEIELLEQKIADLYLTDDQKKTILKSRINALQADVIREEAAAEVEEKYPNIGALQFSRKVEEIARPKMKKLFDQVLDEHKFIIDQAEKRKEIPLNPNNPEDYAIMLSIRKEAGGDKEAAKKLAKKKGYTW